MIMELWAALSLKLMVIVVDPDVPHHPITGNNYRKARLEGFPSCCRDSFHIFLLSPTGNAPMPITQISGQRL